MTTYRILTPGPGFTKEFATADEAMTWVERYLPCKSTHTRTRFERTHGGVLHHYTHVLNRNGKLVTGAVVFEAAR